MPWPHGCCRERLARRLVAELAAVAGDRYRWTMLSEVVPGLGVSWQEAEAAADLAAREGWIEHRVHKLMSENQDLGFQPRLRLER